MSTPEAADYQYFKSLPWCVDLLDDAQFVITPTPSRQCKASTEDALFAEVLATKDTISACLSMYRRPYAASLGRIDEVRTLLQLGYQLNGYPHICHGGIVGMIIDEVMGLLLTFNKDLEGGPIRQAMVTASLKVDYLKPVRTPSAVLVTATFKDIKGRKHFIDADVRDGEGVVLAKAEALWIAMGGSKEDKL